MDVETGSQVEDTRKDNGDNMISRKPCVGGYGGVEDRSTWVRIQPSTKNLQWAELSFNPVVTFVSLAIILAFALWAMLMPQEANTEFAAWKAWVGFKFTWLYIGSQVNNKIFLNCISS